MALPAETCRKAKAILCLAMLAGAEVSQVQKHSSRSAGGSTWSTSGAHGAASSGILDALEALIATPTFQKASKVNPHIEDQVQVLAEELKQTLQDPRLQSHAELLLEQIGALVASPKLQDEAKRVSEQLEAMAADVNVQERAKHLVSMMQHAMHSAKPMMATLHMEERAANFAKQMEAIAADPEAHERVKRIAEQMEAVLADAGLQERAKTLADRMKTAKIDPFSEDHAELVAGEIDAVVADAAFQKQARQLVQEMEALRAQPNIKDMEKMLVDLTRQSKMADVGHADFGMASHSTKGQGSVHDLPDKSLDLDTNNLVDGLIDKVVNRGVKAWPGQRAAMDGTVLGKPGKTVEAPVNRPQDFSDTLSDRLHHQIANRALKWTSSSSAVLDEAILGKSSSGHGDAAPQKTRSNVQLEKHSDGAQADGANIMATTANVVKAIAGSSLLSMSWSYYYSSMLPGIVFTLVVGLLAAMDFFLIGLLSEKTGERSYGAMWAKCFGKDSLILPETVIALTCFAGCVSYLIVAGDYIPIGLKGLRMADGPLRYLQHRNIAILAVFAVIMPLNFLKDLSMLGYTSILGTFGALYTCALLFVEGTKAGFHSSNWKVMSATPGWFVMIPSVVSAFDGHYNVPEVYTELQDRTPKRWATVTALAFTTCTLLTLICGMSGYLLFGSELGLPGRSNVLNAPHFQKMVAAMLAYFATAISVALAFPITSQSLRTSLESILLTYTPPKVREPLANMDPRIRSHLVSALSILLCLFTALSTDNLGLVIAISGAICDCLLIFVFPPLMYLKLTDEDQLTTMARVLSWSSIVSGSTAGIIGTIVSVLVACGVQVPAQDR